ncbi:MAG: ATP-binding protein [Nitrososphaerales archaeon]
MEIPRRLMPEFLTVTELPNEEFKGYWEQIVGADETKRRVLALMQVCLFPTSFFDWTKQNHLQIIPIFKGRILFDGPPGTGKTITAKACADHFARVNHIKSYFVELGSVRDKFEGQSSKNIGAAFRDLQYLAQECPLILFIDELDSVSPSRNTEQMHDTIRDMVNSLIKMMNKINSSRIFIIGATNLSSRVDHAIKRRFDDIIKFDRPSFEDRIALFDHLLQGSNFSKYVISLLAKRTERFTHDDITKAVNLAELTAFSNNEPLAPRHILDAIKKIHPTGDYE